MQFKFIFRLRKAGPMGKLQGFVQNTGIKLSKHSNCQFFRREN